MKQILDHPGTKLRPATQLLAHAKRDFIQALLLRVYVGRQVVLECGGRSPMRAHKFTAVPIRLLLTPSGLKLRQERRQLPHVILDTTLPLLPSGIALNLGLMELGDHQVDNALVISSSLPSLFR